MLGEKGGVKVGFPLGLCGFNGIADERSNGLTVLVVCDGSGFSGIVVQRFWLPGCSARFEGLRVYLRWEQIGKSLLDQREEITLYE